MLRHGIDLVEVGRIERLLAEQGDAFLQRCFTEGERAYCDSSGALRTARYATRFAAKEAVMKALGTGWAAGVSWQDVEVVSGPTGGPSVALHRRAAEVAVEAGLKCWAISLSHTDTHAIASVVATGADARC